jgi:hypothetical protein
VSCGENYDDSAGMVVQAGFLVGAVVDIHNLDPFIFKGEFVVLGLDFGGILSQNGIDHNRCKHYRPE